MATGRAKDEGRLGVRRIVVGLAIALLVAGSAGAYVPSSAPLAPPLPAEPPPQEAATPADFDTMMLKLERREKELERELDTIGPKLETVHKRVLARGRQYTRLVRVGLLPVGGGFDGLVDHASKVERLRAALTRDLALETALKERQAEARKELRVARAERAPLLVQREAMKQAQQALQQADDRRDAFERAFGGGEPPPDAAVYGADTGPVAADPSSRFAQMKGRLSFPLAGRAVVSNEDRSASVLQLKASRDTAVRAVYPGTVAFAGETDHGLTVVLDHGDRYFTTYGNLKRLDVKVGDALSERGRVGWVTRSGSKPPVLHFELRHGNSALEAASWLGL